MWIGRSGSPGRGIWEIVGSCRVGTGGEATGGRIGTAGRWSSCCECSVSKTVTCWGTLIISLALLYVCGSSSVGWEAGVDGKGGGGKWEDLIFFTPFTSSLIQRSIFEALLISVSL
jgi:hypothetical protein